MESGLVDLADGLFDLSRQPNQAALARGFGEYEVVTEGEERHTLFGHDGKAKLLLYYNRGRMGSYNDAVALAQASHALPDTALVRKALPAPGRGAESGAGLQR
jgi:high affinity Mn2+ porin